MLGRDVSSKRLAILLGAVALCATDARAGLNVPVASRLLTFLQSPPEGQVNAAIVYEPGDAASEAEANAIEAEIGNGITIGNARLRVHRVPATSFAGMAASRIAFVTSGVRAQQQLGEIAARARILTITSDLDCVKAGHCVVAVGSGLRTQITVSRAAAKAADIRFGSAFIMLVKEV